MKLFLINPVNLFFFFLSLIIISDSLYIWQLKEYRLDRLLAHKTIFKRLFTLRFPKPTLKILVLAFLNLLLVSVFFLILSLRLPLMVIFLPLLTFLVTSLTILGFKLIEFLPKKTIVFLARKKLQSLPGLKVIGITGSYGKTSVKEFTATLLSIKFKVSKTPRNVNTLLGIALFILRELPRDSQVLVVEMGAYKRREIRQIAQLVQPQIGIITGITFQHLALFGSLDNLLKAKGELLESLPPRGTAIINGNDRGALLLVKNFPGRKIIYSTEKGDLVGQNIKANLNGLRFTLKRDSEKQHLRVNLLGQQNVLNILAGLAVGQLLGLSSRQFQAGLAKISPLDHTLKPHPGINNTLIIDDSYSENPAGIKAAFEFVKLFKQRKILVMPCLIELGQEAARFHQELGEQIGRIFDLALITTADHFAEITTGSQNRAEKIKLVKRPEKVIEILKSEIKPGDLILIEGRVSPKIIEFLVPLKRHAVPIPVS